MELRQNSYPPSVKDGRMARFALLLGATIGITVAFVGAGASQTQPQTQTLDSPGPGLNTKARWKMECEARADEKGLKGAKRRAAIAKCVKLGALPPELQ